MENGYLNRLLRIQRSTNNAWSDIEKYSQDFSLRSDLQEYENEVKRAGEPAFCSEDQLQNFSMQQVDLMRRLFAADKAYNLSGEIEEQEEQNKSYPRLTRPWEEVFYVIYYWKAILDNIAKKYDLF